MNKLNILLIICLAFFVFACGNTKTVAKASASKTEVNKLELPPNVASNKYAKKRSKH